MTLVESNEAFFFADHERNGKTFRIFNYRMCSYTDMCIPSAQECRGHMFEIYQGEVGSTAAVALVSLPMSKFFNLYENPFTMDLDLTTVVDVMIKDDGSLISTYFDGDRLRLKSKGSLASEQAVDAEAYLEHYPFFHAELADLNKRGYTVNMEWMAPHNRIVIGYQKPYLSVLNIRSMEDGSYLEYEDFDNVAWPASQIRDRWIGREAVRKENMAEFVASIPDMNEIEGYVVKLESGQYVKIKTNWYLALHHTKDNINSPRRLFECVLEEATDDMKSLFHDDQAALDIIMAMETYVEEKYNHMVDSVEKFYEANKDLDRKDYAILGQKEIDPMYFGLVMLKYTGKDFSYKEFLKKQWKKLGIKDDDKSVEN